MGCFPPPGAELPIERDDLAKLQTPEDVARAAVASVERLLGHPLTKAEISEMTRYYREISNCLNRWAADRE